MIKAFPKKSDLVVCDLATGTAELPLLMLSQKESAHIKSIIGLDLSENMLEVGCKKIKQRVQEEKIQLKQADALSIPFPDHTFDVTTMAFGIRNTQNYIKALQEIYRTLKSGGKAIILEFSLPKQALFRALYLFYLRRVLPLLGHFLSGDSEAYRYLNKTIEDFPYGESFCEDMKKHSFKKVSYQSLSMGIVTLYVGEK